MFIIPAIYKNNVKYGGSSSSSNIDTDKFAQKVELTLAEYEALGDSVKTDNIVYFITDAESTASGSNIEISTTIDSSATDDTVPSTKAVYDELQSVDAKTLEGKTASDMNALVKSTRQSYTVGTDIHDYWDKAGTWTIASSSQATLELNFPVAGLGGFFEVIRQSINATTIKYYGFTGTSNFIRVFYKHYFKNITTGDEFWSDWDEKIGTTGGTVTGDLVISKDGVDNTVLHSGNIAEKINENLKALTAYDNTKTLVECLDSILTDSNFGLLVARDIHVYCSDGTFYCRALRVNDYSIMGYAFPDEGNTDMKSYSFSRRYYNSSSTKLVALN